MICDIPKIIPRFMSAVQYYRTELLDLACHAPAVVCCRCSPTQKAQVVTLIKEHTGKRTAAVGDGGKIRVVGWNRWS